MTTRNALCSCGQLRLTCTGEPVRISVCHCLACQQRTGSVFATQARFHRADVVVDGNSTTFSRTGDSGTTAIFHFCPTCGATVYWEFVSAPEFIAVAVGNFADPRFPRPRHSVYEERRHSWVNIEDDGSIEHFD